MHWGSKLLAYKKKHNIGCDKDIFLLNHKVIDRFTKTVQLNI